MEDGLTGELDDESCSLPAAAPPVLPSSVLAVLAELIGLPFPSCCPAIKGIEGSNIAMRVLIVGLALLYSFDLGFSRASERGLTWSSGMNAMARVVMYPFQTDPKYKMRVLSLHQILHHFNKLFKNLDT